MCVIRNPAGDLDDPWVVLRNDQTIGLPLARIRAIPKAQVDGIAYSLMADAGLPALRFSEVVRGKSDTRVQIPSGHVTFYLAQNPSGRPMDPLWVVLSTDLDVGKSAQALAIDSTALQLHRVFPPFLNAVSADGRTRSHGTAVWVAQRLLGAIVHAMPIASRPPAIVPSGVYTDEFRETVRSIQLACGFTKEAQDGNFGPKTRAALFAEFGIDFNDIMNDEFCAMTHTTWVDAEGAVHEWPVPIAL